MYALLPYLAAAAGLIIVAFAFLSPYTRSSERRMRQRMDAIGDAIERETLNSFTEMHETVATMRAAASAATGMAEIYAAMAEIDAKSPAFTKHRGSHADRGGCEDEFVDAGLASRTGDRTIEQYNAYWHERTENPAGNLTF